MSVYVHILMDVLVPSQPGIKTPGGSRGAGWMWLKTSLTGSRRRMRPTCAIVTNTSA